MVRDMGKKGLAARIGIAFVGFGLVATVAARGFMPVQASATRMARPTAAELVQWHQDTATPYQRADMVARMRAAFEGVAQVGVGSMPPASGPAVARPTSGSPGAQLVLAYGISGDHFWITASYADMARGAIWGAVQACQRYGVPGWVCNQAGSMLSSWASGWGTANNHGVWAAVYWWPAYVTGGRW